MHTKIYLAPSLLFLAHLASSRPAGVREAGILNPRQSGNDVSNIHPGSPGAPPGTPAPELGPDPDPAPSPVAPASSPSPSPDSITIDGVTIPLAKRQGGDDGTHGNPGGPALPPSGGGLDGSPEPMQPAPKPQPTQGPSIGVTVDKSKLKPRQGGNAIGANMGQIVRPSPSEGENPAGEADQAPQSPSSPSPQAEQGGDAVSAGNPSELPSPSEGESSMGEDALDHQLA